MNASFLLDDDAKLRGFVMGFKLKIPKRQGISYRRYRDVDLNLLQVADCER